MSRTLRLLAPAIALAACAASAQAQYNHPQGYGSYGWHGWGGGSDGGRTAAGMGVLGAGAGQAAAGAGQRNMDNSQARATNAQTAMGVNNYMWEKQQRNNTLYWQRQTRENQDNVNAWDQIRQRVLNNPGQMDIFDGDTLNAQFEEITNPQVYPRTIEAAQQPIGSSLIKSIPFKYAAGGFTYSIQELTEPENVPKVYDRPEFVALREKMKPIVAELRKQTDADKPPKDATVKQFRAVLDEIKAKLVSLNLEQQETFEAEKYLKALYGMARMLDGPSYEVFLAGVDAQPTAPLCELIIFMHAFNLRFGPTDDPDIREGYSQIYGMFQELRQGVNPPPDAVYKAATAPPPQNDNRAQDFYANMSYQHLGAGGPPAPPKPQ